MNYFKKRIHAFGHAFSGLLAAFKAEAHLKIHVLATIFIVVCGFYFNITNTQWLVIIMCCGLVITAELFNSAIEKLCNLISPQQNPTIKFIKDVSAAAVLILCVMALLIAVIIFGQKII